MVEELVRSNSSVDQPVQFGRESETVDFRQQAIKQAYSQEAAGVTGIPGGRCRCDRQSMSTSGNELVFADAFGVKRGEAGADDRDARRDERQKKREERREKIKEKIGNLFESLTTGDLGNIDNLLNKLKQAPEVIKGVKTFLESVKGVEEVKFGKTDDGKLRIGVKRKEENEIAINEKKDNVTVKSATIGKELSFTIGADGDKFKLDDIQGIKVNTTVEFPKIPGTNIGGPKDVSVDLKSAMLDKDKDGKSVIKAEVSHPLLPGQKLPVVVPLDKK